MHETPPPQTASRPAEVPGPEGVSPWTTAWTLALVPVAFFFGGLAPMATAAHPGTVAVVKALWCASWTLTPLLALASRSLAARPALTVAGRWTARAALVPPVAVILLTGAL
ncbi:MULTISPECIES: hypothetical protein [Streptomyces]|uniref:hypothetical protein n=1 Tax=Streptomyces TaxID=1883 RepID=UPI000698BB37|nr:hypothetical protein [Streptomyces katrae]